MMSMMTSRLPATDKPVAGKGRQLMAAATASVVTAAGGIQRIAAVTFATMRMAREVGAMGSAVAAAASNWRRFTPPFPKESPWHPFSSLSSSSSFSSSSQQRGIPPNSTTRPSAQQLVFPSDRVRQLFPFYSTPQQQQLHQLQKPQQHFLRTSRRLWRRQRSLRQQRHQHQQHQQEKEHHRLQPLNNVTAFSQQRLHRRPGVVNFAAAMATRFHPFSSASFPSSSKSPHQLFPGSRLAEQVTWTASWWAFPPIRVSPPSAAFTSSPLLPSSVFSPMASSSLEQTKKPFSSFEHPSRCDPQQSPKSASTSASSSSYRIRDSCRQFFVSSTSRNPVCFPPNPFSKRQLPPRQSARPLCLARSLPASSSAQGSWGTHRHPLCRQRLSRRDISSRSAASPLRTSPSFFSTSKSQRGTLSLDDASLPSLSHFYTAPRNSLPLLCGIVSRGTFDSLSSQPSLSSLSSSSMSSSFSSSSPRFTPSSQSPCTLQDAQRPLSQRSLRSSGGGKTSRSGESEVFNTRNFPTRCGELDFRLTSPLFSLGLYYHQGSCCSSDGINSSRAFSSLRCRSDPTFRNRPATPLRVKWWEVPKSADASVAGAGVDSANPPGLSIVFEDEVVHLPVDPNVSIGDFTAALAKRESCLSGAEVFSSDGLRVDEKTPMYHLLLRGFELRFDGSRTNAHLLPPLPLLAVAGDLVTPFTTVWSESLKEVPYLNCGSGVESGDWEENRRSSSNSDRASSALEETTTPATPEETISSSALSARDTRRAHQETADAHHHHDHDHHHHLPRYSQETHQFLEAAGAAGKCSLGGDLAVGEKTRTAAFLRGADTASGASDVSDEDGAKSSFDISSSSFGGEPNNKGEDVADHRFVEPPSHQTCAAEVVRMLGYTSVGQDGKERIVATPQQLQTAVELSLLSSWHRYTTRARKVFLELEALRRTFQDRDHLKRSLDLKAERTVSVWSWSFVGIFSMQWLAIVYGTYYLYSWDIMEPITYLMGAFDVIVAYTYNAVSRHEFSISNFKSAVVERRRQKLYSRNHFDFAEYERLKRQIEKAEKELLAVQLLRPTSLPPSPLKSPSSPLLSLSSPPLPPPLLSSPLSRQRMPSSAATCSEAASTQQSQQHQQQSK